jgi:hypothetical protein
MTAANFGKLADAEDIPRPEDLVCAALKMVVQVREALVMSGCDWGREWLCPTRPESMMAANFGKLADAEDIPRPEDLVCAALKMVVQVK